MNTKTVVITGSTRGIGFGLAEQFLRRKHPVIINGRNTNTVQSTLEELKGKGYSVRGVAGNVTDPQTYQAIIEEATTSYGKIDIWINNAGIPQPQVMFNEISDEDISRIINVNITAATVGTKAAINYFKQQGFGKVFNMEGFGSDGRMLDKLSLYGTTKRAINYFSKSVSKEVKEKSIQVGILSPGMVRTDFLNNAMVMADDKEQARNQKVLGILAEDVEPVTKFLVDRILSSTKQYPRINYLTFARLAPKIFRLMLVK